MTSGLPFMEVNNDDNFSSTIYSTINTTVMKIQEDFLSPLNSVLESSSTKVMLALLTLVSLVLCDYVIFALFKGQKVKFHHPVTYLLMGLKLIPGVNSFLNRGFDKLSDTLAEEVKKNCFADRDPDTIIRSLNLQPIKPDKIRQTLDGMYTKESV